MLHVSLKLKVSRSYSFDEIEGGEIPKLSGKASTIQAVHVGGRMLQICVDLHITTERATLLPVKNMMSPNKFLQEQISGLPTRSVGIGVMNAARKAMVAVLLSSL